MVCGYDKIPAQEIQQRCELFLLSERVLQGTVENYFGKQRARDGRNDNPAIKQCLVNDGALRLQNSQALGGNCSQKRRLYNDPVDAMDVAFNNPLPKKTKTCYTL